MIYNMITYLQYGSQHDADASIAMLKLTQFLFQCCDTSASQCPTNYIIEKFNISNII